jgi:4'-phosphopantetheinyl transferase
MSPTLYWKVENGRPAMADWQAGRGFDFLSPEEHNRLAGFRFERRRLEWLLGRRTAKRLLCRCCSALAGVSPEKITIGNRSGGVPYVAIDGGNEIEGHLSISHRDDLAACAWVEETVTGLGIDIERIEKRETSFLEDYFTEQEKRFAQALPEPEQTLWVTLGWSVKESALKVLGVGLRADTREVEVLWVSGLFRAGEAENQWKPVGIRSKTHGGGMWQAWWRKHGEYLLTLVIHSQDEEKWTLQEVIRDE